MDYSHAFWNLMVQLLLLLFSLLTNYWVIIIFYSPFQALTSTAVKKGGLSAGDVAAQYKYKNILFDVKVDTESNVSCSILLPLFCLGKNYLENCFLSQHVTSLFSCRSWQPSLLLRSFHQQRLLLHWKCLIITLARYEVFASLMLRCCGRQSYTFWTFICFSFCSWRFSTSMIMQPLLQPLLWANPLALMLQPPLVPQPLLLVLRLGMILHPVILQSTPPALVWPNQIHVLQ